MRYKPRWHGSSQLVVVGVYERWTHVQLDFKKQMKPHAKQSFPNKHVTTKEEANVENVGLQAQKMGMVEEPWGGGGHGAKMVTWHGQYDKVRRFDEKHMCFFSLP